MENSENFTQEILKLEKKYWGAMRKHDLEAVLNLTDFPCLIAGARGLQSVDKAQFKKMFNANQNSVRTFEFDENKAKVRQISPDAAVVAYQVRSTFVKDGLSDSHTQTIDAVDTSTWVKRGQKWVCAMHTETELLAQ